MAIDISVKILLPISSDFGCCPEKTIDFPRGGVISQAHPDCAGRKGSRAFVGQGRAVKPGPHGKALPGQNLCPRLAVHRRHKGHRGSLVRPGKGPEALANQAVGTVLGKTLLPPEASFGSHPVQVAKALGQSRIARHIQGSRLQPFRQLLRHFPG